MATQWTVQDTKIAEAEMAIAGLIQRNMPQPIPADNLERARACATVVQAHDSKIEMLLGRLRKDVPGDYAMDIQAYDDGFISVTITALKAGA